MLKVVVNDEEQRFDCVVYYTCVINNTVEPLMDTLRTKAIVLISKPFLNEGILPREVPLRFVTSLTCTS